MVDKPPVVAAFFVRVISIALASILVAVLALVAWAIYSSGPHAGDTYYLASTTELFLDEPAFNDARQLKEAGASLSLDGMFGLMQANKLAMLEGLTEVKVVERAKGGAKVAVISGKDSGKLGWILNDDLSKARKP